MARRKIKRFRKKFKKFKRFGGKLKQKVRRYVKRYKRRIFKRRVMKQSELKWYTGTGNITPKNATDINPITNYCLGINGLIYIGQGPSQNERVGKKYFVNTLKMRFSYGNPLSANGVSGHMSLVHVKEKYIDAVKINTATAISAAQLFPQGMPNGDNKYWSKMGFISTKIRTQKIEVPNAATVGYGFDQGQKRTAFWTYSIKFNKEIKLTDDSTAGIELPNQYIFFIYYPTPYSHTIGTVPDLKFNYWLTFYDL